MTKRPHPPIRRDWLAKTLAGLLLGAVLAFVCSGLFSAAYPDMPLSVRGQLAMWMVPPVWLGVLSGVYFFASGLRAWLWLGGASALAAGLLFVLRLS
ncbi:hypothetical protein [Achromobacter denitrificans]|uniref:hypothetical protein n=1 Tax=Achromobacter denitrificans TaxID=32002 RepID=UPI002430E671|nr:hypothetical protein [Achromobacter denitrificans]MBV2160525.1 hypothetical protein [Achromobacter denitrificans]